MKRTLFSIAAILCASLVFISCSKDDNHYPDDSSQALTSLFEVRNSDWLNNDLGFDVSFNLDEITRSITDQGAVWIYYSFDDGITFELAPSLQRTDTKGNTFDFLAEAGTGDANDHDGYVTLTALSYSGNSNAAPSFNPNIYIKVVSIPSALYSAHKNVNKNDYNEVKRVFKLK